MGADGSSGKLKAPALSFGKPVDFGADIVIFPPFAWLLTVLSAIALEVFLSSVPIVDPTSTTTTAFSSLTVLTTTFNGRAAIFFIMAARFYWVAMHCSRVLEEHNSGAKFVAVGSLCKAPPFDKCRNPMYSGLLFELLPLTGLLLNTAWCLVMMVPLYMYLRYGVVAKEEAQLSRHFGDDYKKVYCSEARRWRLPVGMATFD